VGNASELYQLVISLSDPDEEVRENAAWALGELAGHQVGSREELGPLIALLGDGTSTVRGMAAWALGRLAQRMGLADERALEPLERLSTEKSLYVSKGAEFALQRVKERF
jgi:HEAT repeat protein